MKTKHLGLITIAFLVLFSPRAGGALVGTAFTYQGRLNDGGYPAIGNYDLRFVLYDAASGPTQIGNALTNLATGVSNGLFGVTLDFGNAFDGNARWLEIAVRPAGGGTFTTLMPRQAIDPTPYALYSVNAATLAGQTPAAFAPASGSSAYVAKAGDTMTGKLNLPANGLSVGSTQLVVAANAVGIGTTAPTRALDVRDGSGPQLNGGNIHVGGNAANGDPKLIHFGDPGFVYLGENGKDDRLEFRATTFHFTNGYVGIWKTNPSVALDVNGNAAFNDKDIFLRTDINHGIAWYGTGKPFGSATPDGPVVYGYSGGALGTMQFGFATNVSLVWNAAGVGINGALNVGGTVFASGFSGGGGGLSAVNAERLDGQHGDFYQDAGNLNAGLLADARLSANVPRLNANQEFTGVNAFATSVGIGTPTPWAALLDVEGNVRINKHDLLFFPGNDMYHGVGFYGADKPFAGVNVNGPVLYGNGGGALGSVGATSKIALQWNDSQNVIGYGDISAPTVTATSQLRIYGARTVIAGFDGTGSHWFGPSPDSDLAFGIRQVGVNDYDFTLKGRFYAASFNTTSDRNAKENFQPIDTQAVLAKVAALPITAWNFKEDAAVSHIGPMAQDFHAAFAVGPDDKHIATVDADGVALAAIQGLNQKLETRNAALEKQVAELRALVETLAAKVNGGGQ